MHLASPSSSGRRAVTFGCGITLETWLSIVSGHDVPHMGRLLTCPVPGWGRDAPRPLMRGLPPVHPGPLVLIGRFVALVASPPALQGLLLPSPVSSHAASFLSRYLQAFGGFSCRALPGLFPGLRGAPCCPAPLASTLIPVTLRRLHDGQLLTAPPEMPLMACGHSPVFRSARCAVALLRSPPRLFQCRAVAHAADGEGSPVMEANAEAGIALPAVVVVLIHVALDLQLDALQPGHAPW